MILISYVVEITLWYRHTGEPEIEDIPNVCTFRYITHDIEITRDIGNHSITHMFIRYGVMPSLEVIAPRLTHLRVNDLHPDVQLTRYV